MDPTKDLVKPRLGLLEKKHALEQELLKLDGKIFSLRLGAGRLHELDLRMFPDGPAARLQLERKQLQEKIEAIMLELQTLKSSAQDSQPVKLTVNPLQSEPSVTPSSPKALRRRGFVDRKAAFEGLGSPETEWSDSWSDPLTEIQDVCYRLKICWGLGATQIARRVDRAKSTVQECLDGAEKALQERLSNRRIKRHRT